jgi:hypothetical protein
MIGFMIHFAKEQREEVKMTRKIQTQMKTNEEAKASVGVKGVYGWEFLSRPHTHLT